MKIAILCVFENAPEEGKREEDLVYNVDYEIARELIKLGHEVKFCNYDSKPQAMKEYDLVLNLCDALEDSVEEARPVLALEKEGLTVTGCPSEAILNCSDKEKSKIILEVNKISTPRYWIFKETGERPEANVLFPVILKPATQDGSIGIEDDCVVRDEEALNKKLKELLPLYKKIIAEEFIDGREFCVPIMGNGQPKVINVLEVDFSDTFGVRPNILSYKAKWRKNSHAYRDTKTAVAKISDEEKEKIARLAIRSFHVLGCQGYASVDIRSNGKEYYVIDVNPNCYLGKESEIVKAVNLTGLDYSAFLQKILEFAIKK